jgi:hypothetical protein
MKKLAEFKVNNGDAREKVCYGLIVAGYVVEVEERKKRPYSVGSINHWVVVYQNPNKKDREE